MPAGVPVTVESNFPVFPQPGVLCNDCYFNIEFRGADYSFTGNQLKTGSVDNIEAHNSFLYFYLLPPSSEEELDRTIGVKTPLSERDNVSSHDLENFPPSVSAVFGIYNYCKEFFEPITNDITQSYHLFTEVELIESYPIERESGPHQRKYF